MVTNRKKISSRAQSRICVFISILCNLIAIMGLGPKESQMNAGDHQLGQVQTSEIKVLAEQSVTKRRMR